MKNNKTLFLGILLAVSTLSGCATTPSKININIGSKIGQITDLKREVDLSALLSSEIKEGVLLAVYSKSLSSGCSCWTGFREEVINKYVRNKNVPIYSIDTDKLSDSVLKKFGISRLTSSSPMFYIFQDGKRQKLYKYTESQSGIFSYEKFVKEMDKMLNKPEKFSMFYVDEEYLFGSEKHINDEKTVLLTERNACSDCSYLIPNFLVPFTSKNTLKKEILIMDIQSYNWNGNDGEDYTSIISKLKLSEASEPTYGFGRGFVPTIQYYENGQVKDAAVTFNDSLIKNGDNYKVDSTYYTEERLANLNFLKDSNVETKVLKGLDVPNEDTDSKYHFWSHEAAFKYHSPILEQFLKTYCL